MEMEVDLVLNQTNFIFFMKMTKTKSLKIQKMSFKTISYIP